MRIKIIKDGIFGKDGELPIGTELSVEKAPDGWAGRYIDLDAHVAADGDRDENGDTPEMAELRRMFDRSYEQQGNDLKAAKLAFETLTGEVSTLKGDHTKALDDLKETIEAKDREIGTLKASATPAPLKAEHHGGGKFNITQGETVLSSGLTKADADAFNAMTDAEKAEYVAKSKTA